ncbi:hypothetical protein AAY473_021107 [Plecturocebus cupreus]
MLAEIISVKDKSQPQKGLQPPHPNHSWLSSSLALSLNEKSQWSVERALYRATTNEHSPRIPPTDVILQLIEEIHGRRFHIAEAKTVDASSPSGNLHFLSVPAAPQSSGDTMMNKFNKVPTSKNIESGTEGRQTSTISDDDKLYAENKIW